MELLSDFEVFAELGFVPEQIVLHVDGHEVIPVDNDDDGFARVMVAAR